jgi:hypothetical protein
VQPGLGADNCAVSDVPNVKVGMKAQNSIPTLSLHGLLQERSALLYMKNTFKILSAVLEKGER